LESDWRPSVRLPGRCAIRRVPAGGDILDPNGDDITAAKLTIDCQIEHGEVASAALDLEFRPDRPDVFGSQRWLCPGQLSLIPRHSLGRGGRVHLILHGHTPQLGYRRREACAAGLAIGIRSVFGPKRTSLPVRRHTTCSDWHD